MISGSWWDGVGLDDTVDAGARVGGVVNPQDVVWEASPGFLAETFRGRAVMFLAAPAWIIAALLYLIFSYMQQKSKNNIQMIKEGGLK